MNIGPLTTTFTAPASCATATGLYQIWPSHNTYYYQQGPLLSRQDCYPSGYEAKPSQYYSPGVCPSGYTPACSSVSVTKTVTETAYACCPTAASYTCTENPLTASSQPYLGCTTTFDQAWAVLSVTAVASDSTYIVQSTVESAETGLGAHSIAVRFQAGGPSSTIATGSFITMTGSSSLPAQRTAAVQSAQSSKSYEFTTLVIPAPTRQGNLSTSSSSSTSSSMTPTATTTMESTSSLRISPGVTTSQAVGIGVGSAALALLIAGAVGSFLWLRHRRRRKTRPPRPPPKDDHNNLRRWRGRSSIRGRIRSPFELDTEEKKKLFELCGQGSPPMLTDPLRSNPLTPYWSPPSLFGFQPAELETPLKGARTQIKSVEMAPP